MLLNTGVCEINAHRNHMNLQYLGPRMSPNHIHVYGVVTRHMQLKHSAPRAQLCTRFANLRYSCHTAAIEDPTGGRRGGESDTVVIWA